MNEETKRLAQAVYELWIFRNDEALKARDRAFDRITPDSYSYVKEE